ncbi:cell adhesion molecule 3-like isoform X2 [Gigantopelta aegis]|uniref:cell adhesion molecule 3-like isoform X2 n=1 Tax=Gigantopelta aegis TaxID=1735272 RepID=UPI001B88C7E4|nr:cell adhesion molecule 3-like isoform X2 [Gigantopelta aegis]
MDQHIIVKFVYGTLCILCIGTRIHALFELSIRGRNLVAFVNNTLKCVTTHDQGYPEVTWSRDDQPVPVSAIRQKKFNRGGNFTVISRYTFVATINMNRQPPILFYCKASFNGKAKNSYFAVDIFVPPSPPKLTIPQGVLKEGDSVKFVCESNVGMPAAELHWRLAWTELTGNSSETQGEHLTYNATNSLGRTLTAADHGKTLSCVWNWVFLDTQTADVTLRVMYVPKPRFTYTTITVPNRRDPITLECFVDSFPNVSAYSWRHDEETLHETRRVLEVLPSDEDDAPFLGNYTCEARNTLGTCHPITFYLIENKKKEKQEIEYQDAYERIIEIKKIEEIKKKVLTKRDKEDYLWAISLVVIPGVVVTIFGVWWVKQGRMEYQNRKKRNAEVIPK